MLSPKLARRITAAFPMVDAFSAQRLGQLHEKDPALFVRAREAGAIVLTKDRDFADEALRSGSPTVIWIRSGNTRTDALWPVLERELAGALDAVGRGQVLVELGA